MKVIGENNSEEQKLLEEKRKQMNELIDLNNVSIKENITLLINDWCAEHIKQLHKEYPHTEWLAFCKIQPQGKGVFLMTDMIHPGQRTTSGDVETTEEGMKWLNEELLRRGENGALWNCVLHSHHSMGCFWSSTDDNARKSLNDGRQLAWAVVTAYDKDDNINYKGCLNFYKPYNIEIDANVRNVDSPTIVEKYNEYLRRIDESEANFYEYLLDLNKEYIDSITETPSYANISEYLGIDITDELKENYNEIKDKIGNPELLDYLKQLNKVANECAINEVNTGGVYTDMLVEYGAFCDWSDNLLTQLETNKKATTVSQVSLLSSTTDYPLNRYLEDDDEIYEFTSSKYAESYIRHMFRLDNSIPLKVGPSGEWLVWCLYTGEYMYIEDWADEYYYYY